MGWGVKEDGNMKIILDMESGFVRNWKETDYIWSVEKNDRVYGKVLLMICLFWNLKIE